MDRIPTVLVVDDEEAIRDSCRQILERAGCRVETARDAAEGLWALQRTPPDLVILDLRMPGMQGTEFLKRARAQSPDLDVIVITGYSSVKSAVECMRLGAYDYVAKPFDADTLRLVVQRALEKHRLAIENQSLRRRLEADRAPDALLGEGPAMRRVRELIERIAPTESTVLILGESGTGKELVARAIHRASPRCHRPFIPVDCAALAETLVESELFGHVKGAYTGAISTRPGRFELAAGGTVFLDEIGNISLPIQSKLLRVLQEKEVTKVGGRETIRVDVRIIAATNQDLQAAMGQGRFREDLFYRLSVVRIEIPPLRDRREDIPVLAEGLLRRLCDRKVLPPKRISPEAMRLMQSYAWPGNVREMENALERAMVLARGPELLAADLHPTEPGAESADAPEGGLSLSALESHHIRRVLDLTQWKIGRAAELLGIDRKTLWRKLKSYGLR
jgi:DNA-binding NtrC family response regulator